MFRSSIYSCLFALLVSLALLAGCSEKVTPPTTVPVEQLAAFLDKAFEKAKPDVKSIVANIVEDLKKPDYAMAYSGMQKLSAASGLTKSQASAAASGLMTVNEALLKAQSQGDQKAAQTLQQHRIAK